MRKVLVLVLIIVCTILNTNCSRDPIDLPQNLEQLYGYNWTVVQDESEPDVFQFRNNGKLYIFNYNNDFTCDWSISEDKITISKAEYKRYNNTFTAVIFTDNNETFLKLGNILLKGSKLSK